MLCVGSGLLSGRRVCAEAFVLFVLELLAQTDTLRTTRGKFAPLCTQLAVFEQIGKQYVECIFLSSVF